MYWLGQISKHFLNNSKNRLQNLIWFFNVWNDFASKKNSSTGRICKKLIKNKSLGFGTWRRPWSWHQTKCIKSGHGWWWSLGTIKGFRICISSTNAPVFDNLTSYHEVYVTARVNGHGCFHCAQIIWVVLSLCNFNGF